MGHLEIIASSLEDALAAVEGGADSLECCVNLAEDGLTMPIDTLKKIREAVAIPLNVLIREHNRDFVYSPEEHERMLRFAIDMVRPLGVNTIVYGAHRADHLFAIDLVEEFAEACQVPITIHRAIDTCSDPERVFTIQAPMAQRVLTSGTALSAWEGRDTLKRWVAQYGKRFRFAIASKVSLDNIVALAQYTQAHEYHVGNGARINGRVDTHLVRQLKTALENAHH